MSFKGIHHIAIRVRDLDAAIEQWTTQFGLELDRRGENEELGIRQAFLKIPDGGFFELISPMNEDSPVAKTIESRGEGVNLISMSVENAESARAAMKEKGVNFAGPFVHPKSANGVMFGLTEED